MEMVAETIVHKTFQKIPVGLSWNGKSELNDKSGNGRLIQYRTYWKLPSYSEKSYSISYIIISYLEPTISRKSLASIIQLTHEVY